MTSESPASLTCTPWRPTYVLELPTSKEYLRFGDARNRHNLKWAVKKAERNGISVRPAENDSELKAWYPLYLRTMRRNSVPPRSLRLFIAMWSYLKPLGLMSLHLAEQENHGQKKLVAGSIFLRFRDTLWYAFTGASEDDLTLHANDLILWNAIHDACGHGLKWMDFGEVAEEHPELTRFKTKWGALPRPQYRYYSAGYCDAASGTTEAGRSVQFARSIWRHLPLGATAWLGSLIYSRL